MSARGVAWTRLGPSRLIGEKGVRALCPAGGRRLDRSHSKGPFLSGGGPPGGPPCPRLAPPAPSAAIQTAIRLQAEGKTSLHKDLKQKRREQREQRERRRAAKEEEMLRLQQLQEEKERKLQELELLQEAQRQAERLMQEEEERHRSQHRELQQALEVQLREAEQVWLHPGGGCGPRGEGPARC